MSTTLIGDREKLAHLRDARRAGLVALADYLTDLDAYPDPWGLFAKFCPGVPLATVEAWASELLRCAVMPDNRRVNSHNINLALDYLTGERW